jgi:superfamily II DNA or RNA helicase
MNVNALVESRMNEFRLDDYQRKAFKNAFTNNITLIQGPPGTGKTFIGEKIAKLMLEMLQANKKHADGLTTGPIFLTCHTNHALD